MKKQIGIFLLSAIATTMTGCYDLNRNPYDSMSSTTFWQTETQCKQGIMGVYSTMYSEATYGGLFKNEINSDAATGYDQRASMILGTWSALPSNLDVKWINGTWSNTYEGIHRANTAIRNLKAANIDAEEKTKMLAEAHFMRGLYYFDLTKYYGGVPIYDESVNIETDYDKLNKVRSTTEQVREFAIEDMKIAAAGLPIKWDNADYGRATRSAAYAIMGKIYLFEEDYTNALVAFCEVVKPEYGHELYPNYADLFKPAADGCSEMIFSVQCIGGLGHKQGIALSKHLGNKASYKGGWSNIFPSDRFVDSYENLDGSKFDWSDLFPGMDFTDPKVRKDVMLSTFESNLSAVKSYTVYQDKIREAYENRDPRLEATVITPLSNYLGFVGSVNKDTQMVLGVVDGDETDSDGNYKIATPVAANGFITNNRTTYRSYLYRKFVPEGDMDGAITDKGYTPINYPIIRLADVYLMMAEAYNKTGKQTEAVEYINKVRSRVGMPAINNGDAWMSATTEEEVFDRIFHERNVELAAEGIRETDLRRWRLSEDYLADYNEYDILGDLILQRKFNPERDYLWPIPQIEMDMCDKLEQNPGW